MLHNISAISILILSSIIYCSSLPVELLDDVSVLEYDLTKVSVDQIESNLIPPVDHTYNVEIINASVIHRTESPIRVEQLPESSTQENNSTLTTTIVNQEDNEDDNQAVRIEEWTSLVSTTNEAPDASNSDEVTTTQQIKSFEDTTDAHVLVLSTSASASTTEIVSYNDESDEIIVEETSSTVNEEKVESKQGLVENDDVQVKEALSTNSNNDSSKDEAKPEATIDSKSVIVESVKNTSEEIQSQALPVKTVKSILLEIEEDQSSTSESNINNQSTEEIATTTVSDEMSLAFEEDASDD